jgi:hypothetical protein
VRDLDLTFTWTEYVTRQGSQTPPGRLRQIQTVVAGSGQVVRDTETDAADPLAKPPSPSKPEPPPRLRSLRLQQQRLDECALFHTLASGWGRLLPQGHLVKNKDS